MARPEDSRVKIPALVHFTRLGYEYMSLKKMVRGKDYDADTNIFYALFQESINRINATEYSIDEVKKIVEEKFNFLAQYCTSCSFIMLSIF